MGIWRKIAESYKLLRNGFFEAFSKRLIRLAVLVVTFAKAFAL